MKRPTARQSAWQWQERIGIADRKTLDGDQSVYFNRLMDLGDPIEPYDVAHKKYVDDAILGCSAKLPAVDGSQLTNVVRNICIYIDNNSDVIETGIKAKVCIDYACTIQSVALHGSPSGSIVIDIWKVSYDNLPASVANTITASAKPTISSGIKSLDSSLAGWTKSISAGDWLYFNVDSCTTMTNCSIDLKVVTV